MHVYKRKSANLPLSVLNISVKTALCFIITEEDENKAAKTFIQAGFQILTGPNSMFNFMSHFRGKVVWV